MLLTKLINLEWIMAKHGNKKNTAIRTVNLGLPGEPARELIEIYERSVGKMKTSKLIREMIVRELGADKEFDGYKIRQLTEERKKMIINMKKLHEDLQNNFSKLNKLGLSDEDISKI